MAVAQLYQAKAGFKQSQKMAVAPISLETVCHQKCFKLIQKC
jgi:hypothetical protein